ncbi:MAG: hypothetical protein Q4C60_10180 [Eubacteriales bacterium]|nr:hypothetical protein [Eubacteriales bacterium]
MIIQNKAVEIKSDRNLKVNLTIRIGGKAPKTLQIKLSARDLAVIKVSTVTVNTVANAVP